MDRKEALVSIKANVSNKNLVKHMLATEAVMGALAKRLGEEEEEWSMAGLIHDIDVELAGDDMSSHAKLAADIAREMGASEEIAHAILCHNENLGVTRETMMDKALFCADPITGLITAATLVRPEKKLELVMAKSIRKRFKEKAFAAGANREQIALCSEIGLELEEFIELSLNAMKGISGELGL